MKIKLVLIALAAAAIVGFFSVVLIKNNKELDKEGELAAQHDFLPAIQMKNKILLEANEAQNEYSNKLAGIESGEYHMAEDLAAQFELHVAVRKSQQDLAEAEKNLALAKVDEEKALGRISESICQMFVRDDSRLRVHALADCFFQRCRAHVRHYAAMNVAVTLHDA